MSQDQDDRDTTDEEATHAGPKRETDEASQDDAGMTGGSSNPTAEGATGGSDERVGAEDQD